MEQHILTTPLQTLITESHTFTFYLWIADHTLTQVLRYFLFLCYGSLKNSNLVWLANLDGLCLAFKVIDKLFDTHMMMLSVKV